LLQNFRLTLSIFALLAFSGGMQALAQTTGRTTQRTSPTPTRTASPSPRQLQHFNLELQVAALKCEERMKVITQELFDTLSDIRLKRKCFADSFTEQPPENPYADSSLVPKELQAELAKSAEAPSARCKIIYEPDSLISDSFPLTLNKVKLKPASAPAGTIVVKYNGDYYLALWCMGFDSKPLTDRKTGLPFVLFKNFSTILE